jgi:hypothetical protein
MNKRFSVLLLLLSLAILGVSRPGLAGSSSQVPSDLQDRLEKEGWQSVSPGVMQRTLDTRTETLGFGAEGLRFQLIEMKAHLDFLRKELARQPSRELRAAFRAHRAATLRVQAAARKAEAPGGLESVQEGIRAEGADCPVDYDAVVDSFPLTQGVSASASSSFTNDCGYLGEVYAHAYAKATNAANQVATMTQSDPGPGAYRTGGTVTAEASAGVNGVKDCYSYSYAEVVNYDLGITYAVQDTDSRCSGTTGVRSFASDAPSNVALPASPPLDPNSAAIVANLNSGQHNATLYRYGKPAYDASAGTPRTIVCTESWGTCGVAMQPVPINAAWKPSAGSDGAMAVIDYVNRKIYDFYRVAKKADGTVMINADGTVTAGWGSVVDLDGYGGEAAVNGSGLSNMFGTIRVFEMERAAADPENAIQHALAFSTQYACASPTFRYPATKSNGSSTAAACIPIGARVFLDSAADCSTVTPVGEKAICYALKKYGAYATNTGSGPMGVWFETPTGGLPGGSAADPYPGVGLTYDAIDMPSIPWSRLKVAADCRCSPSDLAQASGRAFAAKAASNVPLPASRSLDANSAAIVTNLTSTTHYATYGEGYPVYDASAGTPRTIVCTESWGTCGVALQPVPINPSWKPSPGYSRTLTVVDYTKRKVYDFYQVAVNADGTVKINADGTVTTGFGNVSDLDGRGQSRSVNGAGLSYLFGMVRNFEMARAATDPANAIQHALVFTSQYACGTYRYPAAQSNGVYTGTGCIPVGSRVFLDSGADCSLMPTAGEKAICYALQKYGAYALGQSGATLGLKFEIVTDGQPGGSGPNAYPSAGFTGDYYALTNIPWSRLKVAKDCLCSPY